MLLKLNLSFSLVLQHGSALVSSGNYIFFPTNLLVPRVGRLEKVSIQKILYRNLEVLVLSCLFQCLFVVHNTWYIIYIGNLRIIFSIMYNDEFPYPNNDTSSGTSGHTKEVVVFGKSNGFWLIHSVPKFPRNDTYEYHSLGVNTQMGLCIPMSYSQLHKIGNFHSLKMLLNSTYCIICIQLYYNHLFIYSQRLPAQMADDIPILVKVVSKEYHRAAPYVSRVLMYSSASREFIHVKKVTLPFNITFLNFSKFLISLFLDHSKFAVAILDLHNVSVPWICIVLDNFQELQLLRAGGTMCFASSEVHSVHTAMVPYY
uniref:Uncharacterized protein n=1 Tax=Wuchereria bancrofti TaxID=6293 RepID=A0AAF5Q5V9_WUCBA